MRTNGVFLCPFPPTPHLPVDTTAAATRQGAEPLSVSSHLPLIVVSSVFLLEGQMARARAVGDESTSRRHLFG